jgi:molybdopterin converting factor small subunit
VLFFGYAKELANYKSEWNSSETIQSITIRELIHRVKQEIPALEKLGDSFIVAVNWEYQDAESDRIVSESDEVAIIPPVRYQNILICV